MRSRSIEHLSTDAGVEAPQWGVLLKVRVRARESGEDFTVPGDDVLERMMALLPGSDKRLTGRGSDFTILSWYAARDAAQAVELAASTLRQAAGIAGVAGRLQVIRAHAASVEGRSSPFRGVAARLGRENQWTVYFRAAAGRGSRSATVADLAAVANAIGGPDTSISYGGDREKFLMDDGRGLVIRFWVSGDDPGTALRAAHAQALVALASAGLDDWAIVRTQAATAEMRFGDTFPGVAQRTQRQTEETR
jgi:hypothetical protein